MSAPSKPARDELKVAYSVQMDLPSRIHESRQRDSVSDEYPIYRKMRQTTQATTDDYIQLVSASSNQKSTSERGARRAPSPDFSFPRNLPLPAPPVKPGVINRSSSLITAAMQSLSPRSRPGRNMLASLHNDLQVASVNHDSPRNRIVQQGDGDVDDSNGEHATSVSKTTVTASATQQVESTTTTTTTTTTTATTATTTVPSGNVSIGAARLQASGNWIHRTPQDDIRRREARFTRRLTELGSRPSRKSLSIDGSDITDQRNNNGKKKKKKRLLFSTAELEKIFDQFNEIDIDQVGIINQTQLGTSRSLLCVIIGTDERLTRCLH
jgi:hypothetical protein